MMKLAALLHLQNRLCSSSHLEAVTSSHTFECIQMGNVTQLLVVRADWTLRFLSHAHLLIGSFFKHFFIPVLCKSRSDNYTAPDRPAVFFQPSVSSVLLLSDRTPPQTELQEQKLSCAELDEDRLQPVNLKSEQVASCQPPAAA